MWAVNLGTPALLGVILYSPLSVYLKLAPLSAGQLLTAFGLAGASVLWYEGVKLVKKGAAAEKGTVFHRKKTFPLSKKKIGEPISFCRNPFLWRAEMLFFEHFALFSPDSARFILLLFLFLPFLKYILGAHIKLTNPPQVVMILR